jgi:hypothetical protein
MHLDVGQVPGLWTVDDCLMGSPMKMKRKIINWARAFIRRLTHEYHVIIWVWIKWHPVLRTRLRRLAEHKYKSVGQDPSQYQVQKHTRNTILKYIMCGPNCQLNATSGLPNAIRTTMGSRNRVRRGCVREATLRRAEFHILTQPLEKTYSTPKSAQKR